jgi:Icc-related predicted phosphoesterase
LRALVTTDLHSSDRAVMAIRHALDVGRFDVHLCLGDIITFRPMEYLEDLFGNPPLLTHTVPGNTDSDTARARLEELGLDIHFKQVEVQGVTISGAGGCTPPPFRTAFVVEEEEYTRRAPVALEGAQVLASHGPVYGILDRTVFGAIHVGSRALLDAVREASPQVVLSGHIHEANGLVQYDLTSETILATERTRLEFRPDEGTLFFNPGPAKDGFVGILEVTKDVVAGSVIRV